MACYIIITFVLFQRFTLSAVSPAVLVPSLLRLKRMGYGENGVNTMVIAASSLDDIVSISAFGVLLGIIFSTGTYGHDGNKYDLGVVAFLSVFFWGGGVIRFITEYVRNPFLDCSNEIRYENVLVLLK